MIEARALWELKDAIARGVKASTSGYQATYSHKDADGTHWVTIQGSEEPVPATGLVTSDIGEGDSIRVSLDGGSVSIIGNDTNPGVGATNVLRMAKIPAAEVQQRLAATIATGKKIADQAKRIAEAVGQHVWTADDGLHLTEATEEEFTDTPQGRNMLLNAYGFLLREAETWLASFTEGATAFYDGLGNAAANIVAQFGADGATVGYADKAHTSIGADYFRMEDASGTPVIEVNVKNDSEGFADSGITFLNTHSTSPFLVSTAHDIAEIVGLYEVIGDGTYGDLIEVPTFEFPDNYKVLKISTVLTVGKTYIVKYKTLETIFDATLGTRATEADGWQYPTGDGSVVLGRYSIASAGASIAAGEHVVSNFNAQAALGRYNAIDPNGDYALIVGNGTADSRRSNAFAVGWDGSVEAAGLYSATCKTSTVTLDTTKVSADSPNDVWSNGVCCTVSLSFKMNASWAPSGAAVIIGTVPDGYRPRTLVYITLYANAGSGGSGGLIGYIGSNGSIYVLNRSTLTYSANQAFRFTTTYAV